LFKLVFLAYMDISIKWQKSIQIGLKSSPNFPLLLKTGSVDISGEIMYNGFRRKGAYTKLGMASQRTVRKEFIL